MIINVGLNETSIQEVTINGSGSEMPPSKREDNLMAPKCKTESEKIICCLFKNLDPGNYSLMIYVSDDRCARDSTWRSDHSCLWRTSMVASEEEPDVLAVNINSVSSHVLSLVIIVALIVISFVGTFVWLFKRKSLWIPTPEEPSGEALPMIHKKKVLLLYPRDCERFMTVMKSFGKLLEKSQSIEVFDCHNNEEVLDGPLDWLHSKLSNSMVYIIIVASPCAYLHQEAFKAGHIGTSLSLYKEPTFLDKIFIYGLKSVMEDISPVAYSKNYVIGFREFSDDNCMLSLPTSLRRYIIPDHFQKLLSDMNVHYYPGTYHLQNTVEYVSLLNSIGNLKDYNLKNPCYLEMLLNLI